nr:hypothetical protein [Candidatus Njordarchaeota archaeon]
MKERIMDRAETRTAYQDLSLELTRETSGTKIAPTKGIKGMRRAYCGIATINTHESA